MKLVTERDGNLDELMFLYGLKHRIIAWSYWYITTNLTWIIWFLFTKELCAWNNWAWAFWSGQKLSCHYLVYYTVCGQLCTSPDNLYMFKWTALSYCSTVVTVGSLSSLLRMVDCFVDLLHHVWYRVCFTCAVTMKECWQRVFSKRWSLKIFK